MDFKELWAKHKGAVIGGSLALFLVLYLLFRGNGSQSAATSPGSIDPTQLAEIQASEQLQQSQLGAQVSAANASAQLQNNQLQASLQATQDQLAANVAETGIAANVTEQQTTAEAGIENNQTAAQQQVTDELLSDANSEQLAQTQLASQGLSLEGTLAQSANQVIQNGHPEIGLNEFALALGQGNSADVYGLDAGTAAGNIADANAEAGVAESVLKLL